ncbi:hypothetical protein [uncultured Polaribacter sp.]|uniref:hypothetical protein n=1 Tax=uncultured Polaribacter sp. TaxID=174711 RepID=UPI002617CA84|nr:hypothetical protein [uncultured Polaribacter sp.]
MLIITKNLNFRKKLLIGAFAICAIGFDLNYESVNSSDNIQEARFLGIGVKKDKGSCFSPTGLGGDEIRLVTKSFTVFGIRVGKHWDGGTEKCE